jgi:hypothetical protein
VTGKGNGKLFERQAKGEDGRQGERDTRSVTEKGMESNLSDRQRGRMTDKGNVRQGMWQKKGMASNLNDRQRVRMTDKGSVRQGVWQEKGMASNLSDRQRVRITDKGNG